MAERRYAGTSTYGALEGKPLDPETFETEVLWVQQALEKLRCGRYPELLPMEPDGHFDRRTHTAVEQYQSLAGLPADGIVDAACHAALSRDLWMLERNGAQAARGPGVDDWPRCTLHPGCRGAAVELLQQRLGRIAEQDAELKGPPVDGCYEETTEQAVRRLQKKFGLREDGAADRETWLLAARLAERR